MTPDVSLPRGTITNAPGATMRYDPPLITNLRAVDNGGSGVSLAAVVDELKGWAPLLGALDPNDPTELERLEDSLFGPVTPPWYDATLPWEIPPRRHWIRRIKWMARHERIFKLELELGVHQRRMGDVLPWTADYGFHWSRP